MCSSQRTCGFLGLIRLPARSGHSSPWEQLPPVHPVSPEHFWPNPDLPVCPCTLVGSCAFHCLQHCVRAQNLKTWLVLAKPDFPLPQGVIRSRLSWSVTVSSLQRLTQATNASLWHGFTHTWRVSLPCPEPSQGSRRGQRVLTPPL